MTQADHDRRVDYIEFGATDIGRTKQFYQQVFGWRFQDYGPGYTGFQDGRLSRGVQQGPPAGAPESRGGGYAPPTPGVRRQHKRGPGRVASSDQLISGRRPL